MREIGTGKVCALCHEKVETGQIQLALECCGNHFFCLHPCTRSLFNTTSGGELVSCPMCRRKYLNMGQEESTSRMQKQRQRLWLKERSKRECCRLALHQLRITARATEITLLHSVGVFCICLFLPFSFCLACNNTSPCT